MSIYTLNQVDQSVIQVVVNGKELCVVTSYEDEDDDAQVRAEKIMNALNALEEANEKAYEEWFSKYEPEMSGGENSAVRMYETYGNDLEEVKAVPPGHLWTVLDCDGVLYLSPGFHFVNRINYVICRNPYDPDNPPSDVMY